MTFRDRVHAIVRAVPRGRVVTYGQVAALAGKPRAAREVGWIAAAGGPGIPWQRVVNRFGGLATGYTGGRLGHRRELRRDGVQISRTFTVDLRRYQWWPNPTIAKRLGLCWIPP
ncbi:MAG: MGMT family protein [bacterium]